MQIDRREFLERAALVGATAGLATSNLAGTFLRADDPAPRKVVVGVMGLSRGRALANQFASRPEVEIRYVCDVDQARAADCAEELTKTGKAKPQQIGEYRKMLEDPELDALICAAPNFWHATATIHGLQAGKHVYVEKPCCHTPREGELMIEAARKYGKVVQVGTQRRSSPGIIEAMHLLHDGAIGRVYSARAFYASARKSIGVGKPAEPPARLNYDLWQGPAPRKPYLDNRVPYNWHWFWHWGNGELGNNGVHTIDLCRWGLQVDFPVRVNSSGGRYHFQDDQETPDTQEVSFEFADRKLITWIGHSCNRHDDDDFITFYGDKGSLRVSDQGGYALFDEADKELKKSSGDSRGDIEHIDNFLAAVRDNKPESLNGEIAVAFPSTLLPLLGNIAYRTRRTLTCDPANGHILNDPEAAALWNREYEPGWELKV